MQMLKKVLTPLAAGAAFAMASGAAQADTFDFVLTGDYSAHFQLSTAPDNYSAGNAFVFFDVTGTFPTAAEGVADVYFFSAAQSGGMEIDDFYGGVTLMVGDAVQLYTGTEDAPVFKVGTFALDGTAYGAGTYTLTVTNVSAVPEPESYAMLLGGLGVIGFVASRRRKA